MWRLFKRDISRILINPVALIVTIGIIILPSAYAWLNILANWDPYANTSELNVAVANLDKGTHSSIVGDVNVGAQLTEKLRSNHQLGWKFVSSQSHAIDGVKSGKYYAAIVVDRDFSDELVDMLITGGQQPELHYYVNEKLNPIAPKITDTAATTLENQINTTFVNTVSRTVSEKLNISTDRARALIQGKHAEAIKRIDTSIDHIDGMRDKIAETQKRINSGVELINTSKSTLAQTKYAIDSAASTASEAAKTASAAQSSVQTFNTQAYQVLGEASTQLSLLGTQTGEGGARISRDLANVSSDISHVTGQLSAAVSQNDAALAELEEVLADSGLPQTSGVYTRLHDRLTRLDNLNTAQKNALTNFTTKTQSSLDAANLAVTNLSGSASSAANSSADALSSAARGVDGPMGTSMVSTLGSASSLAHATARSLHRVSTSLDECQNVLNQLRNTLNSMSKILGQTNKLLGSTVSQLSTIRTDMAALDSADFAEAIRGTNLNPEAVGSFMQSPVELDQKRVYPVAHYGSSIAPFFTNVAMWVGGFVLIAVMKIEVDRKKVQESDRAQKNRETQETSEAREALENQESRDTQETSQSQSARSAGQPLGHRSSRLRSSRRHSSQLRDRDAYLGRWLLFIIIAAFQGFVVTVGDIALKVQMKQPVAFVAIGIFTSIVYVSLIYALAATFKHIGKALAVILVIMQVPGSSGTYPIEIMPHFFRAIEPWLPFTYGINAMRETIGGYYQHYVWRNIAYLAVVLAGAMILGLVVRPYLLNLNALFDKRLAQTDLLIGEKPQDMTDRFRLRSVVKSLMSHDEFGRDLRRRAARFANLYPHLVAWGIAAIIVVPIVFLVLLFTVEQKLVFLMLWLLSIVLIDFYLIALEYVREVYVRELGMSELSQSALTSRVIDRLTRHQSSEGGDDA